MSLTPKQARFVEEYLVDLNASQAAVRAGYSAKTADQLGYQLLQLPSVSAAIEAGKAARAERTQITQDDVLRELWAIASADPNELIEYRRQCCRHCYGEGFRYQRTPAERERAFADWQADLRSGKGGDPKPFDELGGVGFDPRLEPRDDCPECFGEGAGEPFVKDTRVLSGAARKLYAGVKVTRDGLEVKTHDKVAALTLVGRHLGLFVDKVEVKDTTLAARLEAARQRARENS